MEWIRGLFSRKMLIREKISALFVDEIKPYLFSFALVIIGIDIFMISNNQLAISRDRFSFAIMTLVLFYCLLENIFKAFIDERFSIFVTIVPAVLLALFFRNESDNTALWVAVFVAYVIRLFTNTGIFKQVVINYGIFIVDAIALDLFILRGQFTGDYFSDKILFTILVILSLATFQSKFPFYYFVILGLIIICLPMSKEPIDWTPVEHAYAFISEKVMDTSYNLSSYGNNIYETGYSTFEVTGGKLMKNETPQLLLTTNERPYFVYTDSETGKKMKMRRTIYLAGGVGAEKQQLVDWLLFLYSNNVPREAASDFSQLSKLKIEYSYINTKDEIAPLNSVDIKVDGIPIKEGTSNDFHKKGYILETRYLDIDYGNVELINLIRNSKENSYASYEELCEYAKIIYRIDLSEIISGSQYDDLLSEDINSAWLVDDGCTKKMRELASEITRGAENDYDKAKRIEAYLRQFPYSTNAEGGHNSNSSMSTAEGMADIADRFLFETQTGYCVHYTSSMIMLLRLSGIPARAMKGFRYVYPFETQENYVVAGDNAHTWPEAFIEGIGWIPFEPTGAYLSAEDCTWHRNGETQRKLEVVLNSVPEVEIEESVGEERLPVKYLKTVGLVVLCVIIFTVLLIVGNWLIRKIRYRYATPEEKLKMDVELIKKYILKWAKEEYVDRGLLSDYIEKAPEELRTDLSHIFGVYYRLMYGNLDVRRVSSEENNLAVTIRERLRGWDSENKNYSNCG